jgi:prophage antirepressor-like protein
MAAALSIFKFEDGITVRVALREDEPWFVISDLATALEYRDAANAARMLDDDEKGTHQVSTPSGKQRMLVCNESGLYSLILRSRKPEAKRFRRWVTGDVLPSIRKTGKYVIDKRDKRGKLASATTVRAEVTVMVRAEAGKTTEKHHHMNEARLVNWALAGEFKGLDRDSMSAADLALLCHLEERNAVLIGKGLTYDQRKPIVRECATSWRMAHGMTLVAPSEARA